MSKTAEQVETRSGATVSTNLPSGYKLTEAGVIPQEWQSSTVAGIAASVRNAVVGGPFGSDLTSKDYVPAGVPVIRGQNMGEPFVSGSFVFVSTTKAASLAANLARPRDLVFTQRGTLGQVSIVPELQYAFYLVSQSQMKVTLDADIANPVFFYYVFTSLPRQVRIRGDTIQTGVPHINLGLLRRIPVPVPPLSQQHAIADALSSVDGLTGALEELIAKKRGIKQAAMQQLLTGKTRLPSFSGKWESKTVGDFASIRNSKVLPSSVAPDMPCVELEHIGQGNGRLMDVSTAQFSASSKYRFFSGDVLFGRLRAYLRKFWLADRDGICTTEIWPLMVDTDHACSRFLHAIVQTERFIDAATISYGTHMPRADWAVIRNFEVLMPRVDEQAAIAAVLSDMDAEIASLEQRRDKTKAIKQGMMQQLLTGRIRLVKPETPAAKSEPLRKPASAPTWQLSEEVLISVLTKQFGSEKFPLGRMRRMKLTYLLRRHLEGQAQGYLKKPAGPYNPKSKYGGPETIALRKGYVREHKSGDRKGFVAGKNIAQADAWFDRWYGPEAHQWLEQFRLKKNEDLELLATVDMAAEELREKGIEVTVATVKNVIQAGPEWKAKLARDVFSDRNIALAIDACRTLFG
jgi:type I restriction enzyme, S subunit